MREHENESRLIAEFDRNSAEVVRIHFVEWKKTTYADIRVWYKTDAGDDSDTRPTTKGLRINAELLPDFIRALTEAQGVLDGGPEVEVIQDGSKDSAGAPDAGPNLYRSGRDTGGEGVDA